MRDKTILIITLIVLIASVGFGIVQYISGLNLLGKTETLQTVIKAQNTQIYKLKTDLKKLNNTNSLLTYNLEEIKKNPKVVWKEKKIIINKDSLIYVNTFQAFSDTINYETTQTIALTEKDSVTLHLESVTDYILYGDNSNNLYSNYTTKIQFSDILFYKSPEYVNFNDKFQLYGGLQFEGSKDRFEVIPEITGNVKERYLIGFGTNLNTVVVSAGIRLF